MTMASSRPLLHHVGPAMFQVVAVYSKPLTQDKFVLLVAEEDGRFRLPSKNAIVSAKNPHQLGDVVEGALTAFYKDTRGIYDWDTIEELLRYKSECFQIIQKRAPTLSDNIPVLIYAIELEYDDELEQQFNEASIHVSTTTVLKLVSIHDVLDATVSISKVLKTLDVRSCLERYKAGVGLEVGRLPKAPPLPAELSHGQVLADGLYSTPPNAQGRVEIVCSK